MGGGGTNIKHDVKNNESLHGPKHLHRSCSAMEAGSAGAGSARHADFVPMLMSEEVWKRWRLLRTKAWLGDL